VSHTSETGRYSSAWHCEGGRNFLRLVTVKVYTADMRFIVHSYIVNGDELMHNLQSDNKGRLKNALRLLESLGYERRSELTQSNEWTGVSLWSLADREYYTVPRRTHNAILRSLDIPVNNAIVQPNVISTYAHVKGSRTTRHRRPSSPVRMRTA